MTAQIMEKLIFNGKEVSMASEPLAFYLSNLKEKPELFPPILLAGEVIIKAEHIDHI